MRCARTVAVTSAEHTSQMYFRPPSVPRDIVFFLMTPILQSWRYCLSCSSTARRVEPLVSLHHMDIRFATKTPKFCHVLTVLIVKGRPQSDHLPITFNTLKSLTAPSGVIERSFEYCQAYRRSLAAGGASGDNGLAVAHPGFKLGRMRRELVRLSLSVEIQRLPELTFFLDLAFATQQEDRRTRKPGSSLM